MLSKIQTWLQGKKTYLTAVIGVLAALTAFADHQIDAVALAGAVWAGVQTCFIRAGIDNSAKKQQQGQDVQ